LLLNRTSTQSELDQSPIFLQFMKPNLFGNL